MFSEYNYLILLFCGYTQFKLNKIITYNKQILRFLLYYILSCNSVKVNASVLI